MALNVLATLAKTKRSAAIVPLCRQFASAAEQALHKDKIGTREIVGFGWNGLPAYADRVSFPFPAIRWREDTPEIKVNPLYCNCHSNRIEIDKIV